MTAVLIGYLVSCSKSRAAENALPSRSGITIHFENSINWNKMINKSRGALRCLTAQGLLSFGELYLNTVFIVMVVDSRPTSV